MLCSHEETLLIFFAVAPCSSQATAWQVDLSSIEDLLVIYCFYECKVIFKGKLSLLLVGDLSLKLELFLAILYPFSFHLST